MSGRMIGLAAFLLLAGGASLPGSMADEPDRPWGEPSGGLRSRIWIERSPEEPEDRVMIRYEIQNVGKESATVWHSGFWPNHRVDATTLQGEEVEPTAFGKERREAFKPLGGRDKNAPRVLEPDQIDSAWEPIDVGRMFVAPAEGFRVRVVYQEGRMEPVESNLLEVPAPAR